MKLSYSHKYNLVDSFDVKGSKIKIGFDNTSRWICDVKRATISNNNEDYDFTLFDNYGEIYRIKWLNSEFVYDKNTMRFYDDEFILHPKNMTLYPFPNIAIDVLKTISDPIGLETLRRIAHRATDYK